MDQDQTAAIFEHLFEAACELDEARALASALAAQDESAAALEQFIVNLNSGLTQSLFGKFSELMTYSDFPAISSILTWDQVRLPPSVSEADVDAIILSVMKPVLQKVAMVVVLSLKRCRELGLPISDETLAARIGALVDSGRIEGAGDLRRWRHSEVRLKP